MKILRLKFKDSQSLEFPWYLGRVDVSLMDTRMGFLYVDFNTFVRESLGL